MFFKNKFFVFFIFLLVTKSLFSQEENEENIEESIPFDAVIESEMGGKRMKFYGNTRFNFNQAYFSNWISGGESALTFLYGLDYNFNYSHQASGIVSKDRVNIDLHHRVTDSSRQEKCLLSESILRNASTISYGQESISVPSDVDLFMHLLTHGTYNLSGGPIFFIDIYQFLSRNLISKEELEIKAKSCKLEKELEIASDIFNINTMEFLNNLNKDQALLYSVIFNYGNCFT